MKVMRRKNTICICSCNRNCLLMTNKNCLELHGTLKLSTWLSNFLRADLRIVRLGDSYYPSVHVGLYKETRIILLSTLVYTKRRNCHTVDGNARILSPLLGCANIPAVIGSFHACPVTWSTWRVFVIHKRDISCFVTKVRTKKCSLCWKHNNWGTDRQTNQLTV
jgi:hypothetical protein